VSAPTEAVRVEVVPPAPADPSALIFDADEIAEIALDIDPAYMVSLLEAPETWVPGAFRWKGVRYEPVGIRIKGENSFQPITDKPSLKIQFDQYADLRFLGLDRVTLDNMTSDATMMHEHVAYWAYRTLGVPAVRSWYARLTLNGIDYGLYVLDEDVDATMAERWYPTPLGTMYEMVDADFDATYEPAFELEFGIDDRAPLGAVTAALALGGDDAWLALGEVVDLDAVITYFAVSAVIAQNDAYPYRYPGDDCHWYLDPGGLLAILPHGTDETFNASGYPGMLEMSGQLPWFCTSYAPCRDAVVARIWEVQDELAAAGLYDEALRTRDAVLPSVWLDPRKLVPTPDVYAAQLDMLAFIAGREADIAVQAGPRP
jgi:spore coat protein CotH